jgi:cytochrome c-type biogenesis protein CcmH
MKQTIATLRTQLQQLQALHKDGTLGQPAYDSARAQLERKLLDLVLADPAAASSTTHAAAPADDAPRPSMRLVASLAAAVLVVAGVGYGWNGSPGLALGVAPSATAGAEPASPHDSDDMQFAAAVDKLAAKLETQPDNADGWAILARSYSRLNRFAEAVPAYAKAIALSPNDANLLADYADALAVSNDRRIEGEPLKLVERALKIDPDNAKALALAGTAAFDRKDYAGAVRYWERLAAIAPPDNQFMAQLQGSIAEARELGGLGPATPGQPAQAAAAPRAEAAPAPVATSGNAGVRGTVRLAPAMAKLAAPTDTVFIFARAAEGPRMPLAILRKQVKDLPADFSLDDSLAMSPAAKLSLFPKIVVSARVSKSGQAQPSAGDLSGQSAAVANNASGVGVEINEVVKN